MGHPMMLLCSAMLTMLAGRLRRATPSNNENENSSKNNSNSSPTGSGWAPNDADDARLVAYKVALIGTQQYSRWSPTGFPSEAKVSTICYGRRIGVCMLRDHTHCLRPCLDLSECWPQKM